MTEQQVGLEEVRYTSREKPKDEHRCSGRPAQLQDHQCMQARDIQSNLLEKSVKNPVSHILHKASQCPKGLAANVV